jgi:hypothetical protein
MSRPTLAQVFGPGTVVLEDGQPVSGTCLVIPESSLGGFLSTFAPGPDAQVTFAHLLKQVMLTLNESNRGTNVADYVSSVTYGEYDQIFDPPGSNTLVRRDVFSVLFYQSQQPSAFDPNNLG